MLSRTRALLSQAGRPSTLFRPPHRTVPPSRIAPMSSATNTTAPAPAPSSNPTPTSTSTTSPPTPSKTPLEDAIRTKLTTAFTPTHLKISNDSHLHAHHAAMQSPAYAANARETHFRVHIVSDAFTGKMQPARHRMVYRLLQEEMQREGGIHALQLSTRTAEEEEKRLVQQQRENQHQHLQ